MDTAPFETYEKHEIWNFFPEGPELAYTAVFIISPTVVKRIAIQQYENQINLDDMDLALSEAIPPEDLWPLPMEGMTPFDGQIDSDVYVKGPNLGNYDMLREIPQCAANLLLQEAEICEKYLQSPPRNVARYLGYTTGQDGRIRGLCFTRYQETLQQCMDDRRPLDMKQCLSDIRAGLQFIHGKQLVHNDINSLNVMLDKQGRAVIIDFDSCRLNGTALGVKPGVDLSAEISEFANDFRALKTLEDEMTVATAKLTWWERVSRLRRMAMIVSGWWERCQMM